MASISKNLHISSKDQLYKLINQNEELSTNNIFIPFMDSMNDHYYGCRCDEVAFRIKSDNEYDKLDNENVINLLKDFFKCDSVKFIK